MIKSLAAVLVVLLAGCATTTAIEARFPARYPAVSEMRKIAVTVFEGPAGPDFSSALESVLVAATFDGQRHFNVVESGDRSHRADPERAAAYGRQAGVRGVIFGSVQTEFNDTGYQRTQRECARRENNKCVRSVDVAVPCNRRTLDMVAMPRMVDVATRKIVYAVERRASKQLTWCAPNTQPQSDLAFVAAARDELIAEIRKDLAPYNGSVQATLKTDASGLAGEAKSNFSAAVKLSSSSIAEACNLWTKVDAASPNHAATIYNLGVCAESAGNYPLALAKFRAAQILKPDKQITEAILTVEHLRGAQGTLSQQASARAATADAQRRSAAAAETQQRQRAAADTRAAATRDRQAAQIRTAAADKVRFEAAEKRKAVVAKYGAGAADAIIAGQIKVGMNQAQVQAARGRPTSVVKISASEEMWRYGAQKVVFTGGRVTLIK